MQRLPLTWRKQAMLDDEDFPRCKPLRWYIKTLRRRRKGRWVETPWVHTEVFVGGRRVQLGLGRYILDAPAGARITFVNHNHLDYRKANLKLSGIRQDMPRPKKGSHAEILAAIEEGLAEYA